MTVAPQGEQNPAYSLESLLNKEFRQRGTPLLFVSIPSKQRPNPLPIEPRDVLPFDEFRTLSLAGVGVGATAKAQFIHLCDHLFHAVGSLDFALR